MAELNDPVPLPPGWDCKYDPRSSRYYFVNYYTKTTTWDDPRLRHQQFQNHGNANQRVSIGECIPLQHGSPDLRRNHVYPSNSHASPLRAFQMPANYSPKAIPLQEMKGSPLANRHNARIAQESVFATPQDTEQLVTKIGSMFPTVTETHIRLLLKKYYNREAVVMSALQVEKHPITTPGPYSTPPPPIKNLITRGGSPIPRPGSGCSGSFIGSPRFGEAIKHSPRPHSSPKMKLRYMKSIFPSVEETVLLDVLCSNENNVQKASEVLLEMGYEKKDMKPPKLQQRKSEDETSTITVQKPKEVTPPPRMKTLEEKEKIKAKLQGEYPNIPEQIISLALDSVNYKIDRANQILQIMVQEDSKPRPSCKEITEATVEATIIKDEKVTKPRTPDTSPEKRPVIDKDLNKNWRNKTKNVPAKTSREQSVETDSTEYKSSCIITPLGPNLELQQGPNNELLLPEYTTWNGANPNLANGRNASYAKGPNQLLLQQKTYHAKGPNVELRKGPIFGLAKGSIYSQLKSILNESRGK